ncbi:hypothetical protein QYE76_059848 [Lolium multiflorum]|uniref:RNase H type-1 domain-containing protein n=1 Tax=Lolium multiflorum TaxID=4521 RepID=A0AAD8RZD6_LOLMU|nr:hypothetical protein QYE76_059848 [Lolium multiflorum]
MVWWPRAPPGLPHFRLFHEPPPCKTRSFDEQETPSRAAVARDQDAGAESLFGTRGAENARKASPSTAAISTAIFITALLLHEEGSFSGEARGVHAGVMLGDWDENINPEIITDLLDQRIDDETNNRLCAPFTKKEISDALFQISPLKAPGPDGFPARFLQRNWALLRDEVVKAVQRFFTDGVRPEGVNDMAIVLIPKKNDPEKLKDFRPISLCNVIFKVVSKCLTSELSYSKWFCGFTSFPSWTAPVEGSLKANVDAGWDDLSKKAGLGIVIRDHSGGVLLTEWKYVSSCASAEEAELLAILSGIKHLLALGSGPGVVESDCLKAVQTILGTGRDSSGGWALFQEARDLLRVFNNISVIKID